MIDEININYIDVDSDEKIANSESFNKTIKEIDGYELLNNKEVSVSIENNKIKTSILYKYKKIEVKGSITVRYIDPDFNEDLAEPYKEEGLKLGQYNYEAKEIDGYYITGESSKNVILSNDNLDQTIVFEYKKDIINWNETPYISTYYFNFKPSINDDVIVPFYVTDYNQSEYLEDKTDIEIYVVYQIDDNKSKFISVPLGNNEINLGKLSVGEHYFSLQAVDKASKVKSNKLYNEVLVVDPETYNIKTSEIYNVTSNDLNKYSITSSDTIDDTAVTNNRVGLNKLFSDLKSLGYRKCILPANGYYRIKCISRSITVDIPSEFTVDMNGSTFKLNTVKDNNTGILLVRFNNCYDSHLINGILEGDRFERKALGLEVGYYGEPINTLMYYGGKYCSFENLKIKATTGHTLTSGCTITGYGSLSNFSNVIIVDGKEVRNDKWITSELKDISAARSKKFLTIGRYLGYRGVIGNSLNIYLNYYDENKNFIETIVGYQYRRTRIPDKAKYLSVSIMADINSVGTVSIFYNELGINHIIKNIEFEETRTTALAISTANNLLIDNCSFTNCGYKITPCPVDFEDGWQECQDIYFRNCSRVGNRVGTADIIDNSGYNHIYENNDNIGYTIRYSVVGLVIRNNSNADSVSSWVRGYETGSKFARIYNNIFNGLFNSTSDDKDEGIISSLLERCRINCNGLLASSTKTFKYVNSIIYKFNGNRIKCENCDIHPYPYLGSDFVFKNCNFYNMDDKNSSIRFSFNAYNTLRKFISCSFKSVSVLDCHNQFNSGYFENCIFEKDVTIKPNNANTLGDIQFVNCIFEKNTTINIKNAACYVEFINCTFKGKKVFVGYGEVNSIFK